MWNVCGISCTKKSLRQAKCLILWTFLDDVLVIINPCFTFYSAMCSTEIAIEIKSLSNSEDVEQPDIDPGRNWKNFTLIREFFGPSRVRQFFFKSKIITGETNKMKIMCAERVSVGL